MADLGADISISLSVKSEQVEQHENADNGRSTLPQSEVDYLKYVEGTPWERSSPECQDWLKFKEEIEMAASMSQCPVPVSGNGLLKYLIREDVAVSLQFRKELDIHGFMYYKLFTVPRVAHEQKEKLYKTKRFEKHIGELDFLFLIR